MLLFIWLNIHLCEHVGAAVCVGELCGELCGVGELCKGNCVGSYVGGWVALCERAVWVGGCRCAKELWGGHAHQSPDGPGIHTPLPPVLPAQGGFPTTLSPTAPYPTHSSSQVVHCRVCPPHPLHAPVLVLHLAVYPASPTQGRVGLTDRLPYSAQTQCNVSR